MTRILVTGATGQVGKELSLIDWPDDIELLLPTRNQLDLADPVATRQFLADQSPHAIINTAAFTAVDKAETAIEEAYAINAAAPATLATFSRWADIPLVHLSTDYVFGPGTGPRAEDARPAPTSVYGASKLAGELAVIAASERAIVMRTAWVVSPWGQNFVNTMLRLARDREELRVVSDQRGCPTVAADIAQAARKIILAQLADRKTRSGIIHFVNGGEATWASLAKQIMAEARANGLPSARVTSISSSEFPTPVTRPADSRLATQRLIEWFGIVPRPWQDAIADTVMVIAASMRGVSK